MEYIQLKKSNKLKLGHCTKSLNLTKFILESESGKPINIEYNIINKHKDNEMRFPYTELVIRYSNGAAVCKQNMTFVQNFDGKDSQDVATNSFGRHIKSLDSYIAKLDRYRRIKKD